MKKTWTGAQGRQQFRGAESGAGGRREERQMWRYEEVCHPNSVEEKARM